MTKFEKMKMTLLMTSSVLLSIFTIVSYGHVYVVFGGFVALMVALFFGIAASICIFKLIKKVRYGRRKKINN